MAGKHPRSTATVSWQRSEAERGWAEAGGAGDDNGGGDDGWGSPGDLAGAVESKENRNRASRAPKP